MSVLFGIYPLLQNSKKMFRAFGCKVIRKLQFLNNLY